MVLRIGWYFAIPIPYANPKIPALNEHKVCKELVIVIIYSANTTRHYIHGLRRGVFKIFHPTQISCRYWFFGCFCLLLTRIVILILVFIAILSVYLYSSINFLLTHISYYSAAEFRYCWNIIGKIFLTKYLCFASVTLFRHCYSLINIPLYQNHTRSFHLLSHIHFIFPSYIVL